MRFRLTKIPLFHARHRRFGEIRIQRRNRVIGAVFCNTVIRRLQKPAAMTVLDQLTAEAQELGMGYPGTGGRPFRASLP